MHTEAIPINQLADVSMLRKRDRGRAAAHKLLDMIEVFTIKSASVRYMEDVYPGYCDADRFVEQMLLWTIESIR